jgi:transcriptional regulator with XRE-family HTH domain
MKPAATNSRNFRTFLLVSQFEARAIGERIQRARNEVGLTQEEMTELATFSKRSLQDYEAGVTIPYRHMREIAALTGKPVEWFLYGEDPEISDLANRVDQIQEQLEEVLDLLRGPRDTPQETET